MGHTPPTVSRRRYGGLDVFEVAPRESAELTVVLLHGYGAPGADLLGVSAEAPCRRPCRWLFPVAPHPAPGDLSGLGRAWFPIDEGRLIAAQQTGVPADFSADDPPGLAASRHALAAMIEDAGLDYSTLALGGFSQGSMVATDLILEGKRAPAGLVVLSGSLIAEARWRPAAARRAGLPFFQSHGTQDPLLGLRGAQRLEELLRGAGLKGSLFPFDGGHAIPLDALVSLGVFLDAL